MRRQAFKGWAVSKDEFEQELSDIGKIERIIFAVTPAFKHIVLETAKLGCMLVGPFASALLIDGTEGRATQ